MPFTSQDGRVWYTLMEAAAAWGVSRKCVYNWLKAGKLVEKRTVGGPRRVWSESIWREQDRPLAPDMPKAPAVETCGDCRRKGGLVLYCAKHQPELVPA